MQNDMQNVLAAINEGLAKEDRAGRFLPSEYLDDIRVHYNRASVMWRKDDIMREILSISVLSIAALREHGLPVPFSLNRKKL